MTGENQRNAWIRIRYLPPGFILLFFILFGYFLSLRAFSNICYQKAIADSRSGSFQKSIPLLEKALKFQPNDPKIWIALAASYQSMSRRAAIGQAYEFSLKSEQAYSRALRLNPLEAGTCFGLAETTAQLEQLDAYLNVESTPRKFNALPFYREAIRLRPNGLMYHYALARYLYRHGEDRPLFDVVERLTALYPSAYFYLKKEVFWSPNTRNAAKKGVYRAIQTGLYQEHAHKILSYLLAEEKNWAGAISSYRTAMWYDAPQSQSENYYHLGRLYLQNREPDKAAGIFLKAVSVNAASERDLEKVYRLYQALGYSEACVLFFQKIRRVLNSSGKTDIWLARAMMDAKKYQPARRVLEKHNQRQPDAEAFYWLARIAEIEKNWDAMELAIQKSTVYDPKNHAYHLIFSQVLKRQNKLKGAETAVGRAILHAGKPSASLFNHRAWIRWDLKNYLGAALDWEEAARLDPENPAFHLRAAEAYMAAGKVPLALAHYKRTLELAPDNNAYLEKYKALQRLVEKP